MQNSVSKTLVIGLGGTGQDVIRDIKKRLFRQYGVIPGLIRFLSFDIDDNSYDNTPFSYRFNGETRVTRRYNIQTEEFCKMRRPDLDVLKVDPNCRNLNHDQLEQAFGNDNGVGTSGSRVLGRAHFLYNADLVMCRLKAEVRALRNAQLMENLLANGFSLLDNSVTVYVIASLAGGTGSGAILDISRMLQHAGINMVPISADTPTDKILGMFFMPGFYRAAPINPNVDINTFVALSELDYALAVGEGTDTPEGRKERDNDQYIYGDFHTHMPVRYSNMYLIDTKTHRGNTRSFSEASSLVASFIATSLAMDNSVFQFIHSQRRLMDLNGKKANYSGLGYCEISFERQNLVNYLLNRRIQPILETYKSDESFIAVERLACTFIQRNHLDEERTRDLSDFIFLLDDKRFMIPMRRVDTGKDAHMQIVNCKENYLDRIAAETTAAIKDFALKKKQLSVNLEALLKDWQYRKGFGRLPDLVKCLKSAFESMRSKLENGLCQDDECRKSIEKKLKETKSRIENCIGGFFGASKKREAQKKLLLTYYSHVEGPGTAKEPTLMRIQIEKARKEEAIKVYKILIRLLDSYCKVEEDGTVSPTGAFLSVSNTYDSMKAIVNGELESYQPKKEAEDEIVSIDAYFKEYFDSHPITDSSPAEKDELERYIRGVLENGREVNHELLAQMRVFLLGLLPEDSLTKRIWSSRISLDSLFIHCFGRAKDLKHVENPEQPHLGLFTRTEALLDSLWQYEVFSDQEKYVSSLGIVGVYDTSDHLFQEDKGYLAFLPHDYFYQFTHIGDPDRIVFLLQETALPACKMIEAKEWENEYKEKKNDTYAFSDHRLEGIEMIMSQKQNATI